VTSPRRGRVRVVEATAVVVTVGSAGCVSSQWGRGGGSRGRCPRPTVARAPLSRSCSASQKLVVRSHRLTWCASPRALAPLRRRPSGARCPCPVGAAARRAALERRRAAARGDLRAHSCPRHSGCRVALRRHRRTIQPAFYGDRAPRTPLLPAFAAAARRDAPRRVGRRRASWRPGARAATGAVDAGGGCSRGGDVPDVDGCVWRGVCPAARRCGGAGAAAVRRPRYGRPRRRGGRAPAPDRQWDTAASDLRRDLGAAAPARRREHAGCATAERVVHGSPARQAHEVFTRAAACCPAWLAGCSSGCRSDRWAAAACSPSCALPARCVSVVRLRRGAAAGAAGSRSGP
jgi:hypothetical protein